MGKLENTIKIFKQIHPEDIIIIKVGTFYNTYGKDAHIISYLFGYQIKQIAQNYVVCGFPKTALPKVLTKIEELNLNYITLDKSDNYNTIEQEDFKGKNKYIEIFEKAHRYITIKNRIDAIYQYLIENISSNNIKEKILKIEDILYETR